jgi:hypothetical protein
MQRMGTYLLTMLEIIFKHGVLEVWLVKGSKSSYIYCDVFIFETLSLTYDQSQEHENIF